MDQRDLVDVILKSQEAKWCKYSIILKYPISISNIIRHMISIPIKRRTNPKTSREVVIGKVRESISVTLITQERLAQSRAGIISAPR